MSTRSGEPAASDERPISAEFLRALPKTDVHLHLDGSVRLETLIELAKVALDLLPRIRSALLCTKECRIRCMAPIR